MILQRLGRMYRMTLLSEAFLFIALTAGSLLMCPYDIGQLLTAYNTDQNRVPFTMYLCF